MFAGLILTKVNLFRAKNLEPFLKKFVYINEANLNY